MSRSFFLTSVLIASSDITVADNGDVEMAAEELEEDDNIEIFVVGIVDDEDVEMEDD